MLLWFGSSDPSSFPRIWRLFRKFFLKELQNKLLWSSVDFISIFVFIIKISLRSRKICFWNYLRMVSKMVAALFCRVSPMLDPNPCSFRSGLFRFLRIFCFISTLHWEAGLWIHIHFMRIWIQHLFWMRIRIQVQVQTSLTKFEDKKKIMKSFLQL